MATRGRRLEVCVDDASGLAAAVSGGADRVELCAGLAMGGLTPSAGLIAAAAAAPIPVHAMIRPQAGGFEFGPFGLDVMRRDIDAVRAADLAGVVLGVSLPSGALDAAALAVLCDHAAGLDLTLHRAFDLAPDTAEALETAVALGFHRILTSGGATSALEGVETIAWTTQQAAGRVVVMPGAGLGAETVGEVVRRTGAREVHASCSVVSDAPPQIRAMGFAVAGLRMTSAASVAAFVDALQALED